MKKIILCLLAIVPGLVLAGEATISWVPPVDCSDGSSLENCPTLGFNIEMSKDGGEWVDVTTTAPTATSYKATSLTPGVYSFRVSTSTLKNLRSDPRVGDKAKTVDAVKPNPPRGVTVQ